MMVLGWFLILFGIFSFLGLLFFFWKINAKLGAINSGLQAPSGSLFFPPWVARALMGLVLLIWICCLILGWSVVRRVIS